MHEVVLPGGDASGSVVRVASTIRKAWTPATPSVHAFMVALGNAGVDVPEPLGRDDRGRQILELVPGRLAHEAAPLTRSELHRVGAMVRQIHDASQLCEPSAAMRWEVAIAAPGDELICHNDLAPWNLVIGDRWVFIDWDGAGPSTRLWDLAYAAQSFTLNDVTQPPEVAAPRLAAFADGYRADRDLREGLPSAMTTRVAAMHDLLEASHRTGTQPWGAMFADGHGEQWGAVRDYVERHEASWAAALS
ncbi:phosphotransferase [Agrococcus beijingensis]|uniref:phosphotransferase n=1 Tax=Agrococcus beijingensis TaxID=3068634 RepID=UPI00274209FA|nr:phosphotransferase [Agrococcus sp. REN33]